MLNSVVTGSSTGIGKTTVEVLARAGHRVFATMRNVKDGASLLELAEEEDLLIELLSLDVADDHSVDQAFEHIYKQVKFVDALVCNAGIDGFGTVEETPLQKFRDCMEVNYFGAIRCVQKTITSMRDKQQGVIIMVSSTGGRVVVSPGAPYAGSKFAMEAFSEALAQEAKTFGIRVAIVEPGSTATPIAGKAKRHAQGSDSPYPQLSRFFDNLEKFSHLAEPPEGVAEQIRDIIEGDSWQLRYLVGGDAQPLLDMRNSLSDEQWVQLQSLSGEAYDSSMQKLMASLS